MIDRTTRLRWRRRLRRKKTQVGDIGTQAEEHLERHLFKRLGKLPGVLRFASTWTLLLVLLAGITVVQTRALDKHYLSLQPAPGGTYTEGILGSFTNANPLYATDGVNASVSRLVFAGLFKYDDNNKLVGELAQSWSMDKRELVYTVNLRQNLKWHDGMPLTAKDVVFTYQSIQNPDARSPLQSSWQGIKVSQAGPHKIIFELPNPLSSFRHSLTTGIIPSHLLAGVPAAQLRSVEFNTVAPVGTGPFKWQALQVVGQTPREREEQIALIPNENYATGKPKLSKFIVRSFRDKNRLLDSFKKQQLNGVVGLDELPDDVQEDPKIQEHNIPMLGEVMVFFRNTSAVFKNVAVRQALVYATDRNAVIKKLGYSLIPVKGPLLKTHVGYAADQVQTGRNIKKARALLSEQGWKLGTSGIMEKKGQPLTFKLYSQKDSEYVRVSEELERQWREAGINAEVILLSESELRANHISTHDYDALLYGIELGPDPDVFAYWDSKQADVRAPNWLNFSEYQSKIADQALEAGRTRSDNKLRAIKYKPFLKAWKTDAPAVALYQPRFLCVTRGRLFGFGPASLSSGADRYSNVSNWMIKQEMQPKP